jgi:hypothetical protein
MSAGGEIWVGAERDSQGGGACRGRAEPWSSGWLAGPRARRQSPADLARDLPAGLRAFSLSRSGVPVCGDPCLPSTAVWTVSDSLMSDDPALPWDPWTVDSQRERGPPVAAKFLYLRA